MSEKQLSPEELEQLADQIDLPTFKFVMGFMEIVFEHNREKYTGQLRGEIASSLVQAVEENIQLHLTALHDDIHKKQQENARYRMIVEQTKDDVVN